MHSFRLRYIVLGLLIYIQSAFCRTCGTDFDDLGSRTVTASVVLEGSVRKVSGLDGETGRYNATFSVKKTLKGDLPRKTSDDTRFRDIVVGEFGPEDKDNCISDVGVGNKYIVFLQASLADSDSSVPFYKVSGFPEKPSKTVTRELRKYNCDPQDSCISAPSGSIKPKRAKRVEGDSLKVQCKVKGAPTPVVSWLKDGVPLVPGRKFQVKPGKKGSTLRMRKLEVGDSGKYECVAKNVAGNKSLIVDLRVKEARPMSRSRHRRNHRLFLTSNEIVSAKHEEKNTVKPTVVSTTTWRSVPNAVPCEQQNYCLNGGVCYRLEQQSLGNQFCMCQRGHDGRRCESLADFDLIKQLESRQTHQVDRALTITGLVVAGLVFLTLCIAAYIMARRKRSSYRKKRAQRQEAKERRDNNMSNGNYRPSSTVDQVDSPGMHMELRPLTPYTSPAATQTDRFLLKSLIAEMSVPKSQSSHSSLPRQSSDRVRNSAPPRSSSHRSSHGSQGPHSGLPRQNTAPVSASMVDELSSSRGRLRGVSSTPDVERDRRQGNVEVVNAVVESDPEHTRSSPSQSSVTESAHEDVHKRPAGSPLSDDKSDYDNQASDLEVNIESETDLQGFEASGDDLDLDHRHHPRFVRQADSSEDSSDTADTSSIEDSPEKALFAKMVAANPRVDSLQNNPSDHDSSGHLSWDDFGDSQPQHYAYNPYDDDSDIIANRFLLSDNRAPRGSNNRQSDPRDNHVHQRLLEPVDPDPDATVV